MLWPCAVLLHIRRIALGTGQAHYRVKSHVKACIQETMSIYEQSVSVFVSSWLTQAVRLTPSPCLTWRLKDRKTQRFKLTKTKRRRFRPHPSLKKTHVRLLLSSWGGGSFPEFCTSSSSKLVRSQVCFRHICRLFQCSRKQAATGRHTNTWSILVILV